MLDSRQRGRRFEPHRRHCVVVREQMNPYDDDWVSLRWPNGKDDLDIVRASKNGKAIETEVL